MKCEGKTSKVNVVKLEWVEVPNPWNQEEREDDGYDKGYKR